MPRMRALSALWGEPITPAVTGTGEEGYTQEDVRTLIWGKGSRRSVPGPGREALKPGCVHWGCFSPARGHRQCLEVFFIVTTEEGALLAFGG